jgi:hypothetical protein
MNDSAARDNGSPEGNGNGHAPAAALPRSAEENLAKVVRGPDGKAVLRKSDYLRPMSEAEEMAALATLKTRGSSAPVVTPPHWALASAAGGARPKSSGYDLLLQVTAGVAVLPDVLEAVAGREAQALQEVAERIHASAEAERLGQSRQRLEELRRGESGARAQLSAAEAALNDADAGAVSKLARKKSVAGETLAGFGGPVAKAAAEVAEAAAALEAFARAALSRTRMALCGEVNGGLPAHNKSVEVPPDVSAHAWLLELARRCELGRRTSAAGWGQYAIRQALARHLPPPPEVEVGTLMTQAEWMLKHTPEATEQVRPAASL